MDAQQNPLMMKTLAEVGQPVLMGILDSSQSNRRDGKSSKSLVKPIKPTPKRGLVLSLKI